MERSRNLLEQFSGFTGHSEERILEISYALPKHCRCCFYSYTESRGIIEFTGIGTVILLKQLPISNYFWDINNITEEEVTLFLIDFPSLVDLCLIKNFYKESVRVLLEKRFNRTVQCHDWSIFL